MALISEFEGNVIKHVRGCFRSSAQKWITEPKCELRPSKKHGLGLFATRDILPYELITLYPVDGVRVWLEDGKHTIYLKQFEGMDTDTCVDYSADVPTYKGWRIEIVGDPAKISDPLYLGHMANDYCQMTKTEQKDIYANISMKGMNALIGAVPFEACFPEGSTCGSALEFGARCRSKQGKRSTYIMARTTGLARLHGRSCLMMQTSTAWIDI